jgi:diaminopimelate epimerase
MNSFPFAKLHGCGNSFVVLERALVPWGKNDDLVRAQGLCSSSFGLGTDGLMMIESLDDTIINLTMLNPDGSLMGMCGNGIRCVYRYCADHGLIKASESQKFLVEGRVLECSSYNGGRSVRVNMGTPDFDPTKVPVTSPEPFINQSIEVFIEGQSVSLRGTCVSLGNPHFVCLFQSDSVPGAISPICNPLEVLGSWKSLGPAVEVHSRFPKRINVEFVKIVDSRTLEVKVWERGAGPTLACGTGACASAVVAIKLGAVSTHEPLEVRLPGGALQVEYQQDSGSLFMTGPAEYIAEGTFTVHSPLLN